MDVILVMSNFASGILTLVVGSSAIILYINQKNSYKRDIALLIRQEIRYAEQQVDKARSSSVNSDTYPLYGKLLPTNSWYKNIHLFINDFEQSQIDAISSFYSKVEYIDVIIEKISNYKNSLIEETIIDSTGKTIVKESILPERIYLNRILKTISQINFQQIQISNNPNNLQTPPNIQVNIVDKLMANNILRDVSNKVDFIYNTPIGEKFRELSKRKWYKL